MSVDYLNDPRSSIVDALSTMVIDDTQVKVSMPGTTTNGVM